jgi:Domain of unknown function DUF29
MMSSGIPPASMIRLHADLGFIFSSSFCLVGFPQHSTALFRTPTIDPGATISLAGIPTAPRSHTGSGPSDWAVLDLEHLAEEIEDVGNSVRFAIGSHLVRLLWHLLKLRYDPATRPRRGGKVTVDAAREDIAKRAKGGLQHHPERYLPDAYRQARRLAMLAMADRAGA